MLLMMLEKNMQIDDIIFADTGVEFPQVYSNIDIIENHIGRKITRLKSDLYTWDTLFFHEKVKGKRIGKINAFPRVVGCNANTYLKKGPIRKYYKTLDDEYLVYIGIAYNEPKRYARLKAKERAPLYDWGITEDFVIEELKRRGLHNPLYDVFSRQGCYMCPQMGIAGARKLFINYPELWAELLYYGNKAEELTEELRFSQWLVGWTVNDLDNRFKNELFILNNR